MTDAVSAATRGVALLENPLTNRGTAFGIEQRRELGLDGLLPSAVETLEQQVTRAYDIFTGYPDDFSKHVYLRAVQDTNETLFYRLLVDHIEEMLPIVYTPTVAWAAQQFSHIYRRHRGLFLSYPQRDHLAQLLANRPCREVDVIVVTDGQRVLGVGDQGAGGLGISIGKLSLYTAIGGIHPARTLPVVLDVGTNNDERLKDPSYLGWRHERIDGDAYYDFVERFVQALEAELAHVLLQWEDFATVHARPILERYRNRLLTFNDDIQGTAATVAGALAGAVHAAGSKMSDQRIVFLGAGSAAIGVADMLRAQMLADGAPQDGVLSHFYMVDKDGLLTADRQNLTPEQLPYARPTASIAGWSRTAADARPGLVDVIANTSATILIGLSSAAGAFSESVVRTMAAKVDRPIILPLSNPTSRSEADPADLARWTGGRVLTATGSPYPPMTIDGEDVPVAQSNNVFIFPAVGLGVIASNAMRVTDNMMLAAAGALGVRSPALTNPRGPLLPPVTELRPNAAEVALAVGLAAVRDGVAPNLTDGELRERIAVTQWSPAYPEP